MSLSPEDRQSLQLVGSIIMAEQKIEARLGLENAMIAVDVLEKIYNMQVTQLSPAEVNVFREKTRSVYDNWANYIGIDLVRSARQLCAVKSDISYQEHSIMIARAPRSAPGESRRASPRIR
jgi:hypothetical protein